MSRRRVVLKLALVFAAGANVCAQAVHPVPNTATEVFQQSVSGPERATIRLAEAMPEGKYSFIPTNGAFSGVRTFAQLVKHIAVDNYMMGAALLGEKAPIDVGVRENGPDAIITKAQITEFLRDSFAYLHKAVGTVNQGNLMVSELRRCTLAAPSSGERGHFSSLGHLRPND